MNFVKSDTEVSLLFALSTYSAYALEIVGTTI